MSNLVMEKYCELYFCNTNDEIHIIITFDILFFQVLYVRLSILTAENLEV